VNEEQAGRAGTEARQRRSLVDPGAVFAGWVGLGMAVVVAIAFELVVAIQSLVFLFAPIGGLFIGFYANARSQRSRPWWRVLGNATYAGLVTALALALFYGGLRLLFVYADTGFPDYNRTDAAGNVTGPTCPTGPGCTYQRYLDAGGGQELAALGITDVASFERYLLAEQLNGGLILVGLTLGGALFGGLAYGATARARPEPVAGVRPI
jgi:hypothetical protein